MEAVGRCTTLGWGVDWMLVKVTGKHVARDSHLHQPPSSTAAGTSQPLPLTHFLLLAPSTIIQDGWRRLEHEKVLAPAPIEEPGAGLA